MDGDLLRVALFGYPLSHSVSPAMHEAAGAALGLRLRYELWPLQPEDLPEAVAHLRAEAWLGANVTLPHKPGMLALVDEASPPARRIGAVNTLYKRDGRLLGDNTDAPALLRCLDTQLDFQPPAERVLLLGAGGAARAAAVALLESGADEVLLWNRTAPRAAALAAEVAASFPRRGNALLLLPDEQTLAQALPRVTLIVNATSVGLDGNSTPIDPAGLSPHARLFDMVYGPAGTPLVSAARAHGLRAADGLWMLVYQAAASFALWTGIAPDEHLMHEAALGALRARAAREAP
jgi:shikimate dehydrogenase